MNYDEGFIKQNQKPRTATEPAIKYFCDLHKSRDWSDKVSALPPVWQDTFHAIASAPTSPWAADDVSKFINLLKDCDKVGNMSKPIPGSAVAANPPVEDGIYLSKAKGNFYKVYWNNEKNRLLAKEIVLIQDANPDTNTPAISELVYRGQAYRFVTADDKYNPTLEEAIAFGPKYGRCSQCGRNLNCELSVELGIGPVCGNRDFGDAFKVMKKMAQAKLDGKELSTVHVDEDGFKSLDENDIDNMTADELRARLAELTAEQAK